MRQTLIRGRQLYRAGTSPGRMLPAYLIVGAQKGGTTFLHQLLCMHPQVRASFKKEVHYFDLNFNRGVSWYKSHFPHPVRGKEYDYITGEASPYYLFHPRAAERAAKVIPSTKLIAVLRDPVHRAYSHYNHQVKKVDGPLRETLSFRDALNAETDRLQGEVERLLRDDRYISFAHRHRSYLSRGVYVDQLEEWARYFAREQMLVLNSEELFADTLGTLARTLEFLGLPAWTPRHYEPANENRYAGMDPEMEQRLRAYFAPHNQRLYDYLGVDFGW